jgi:dUTP pyrophosphatase
MSVTGDAADEKNETLDVGSDAQIISRTLLDARNMWRNGLCVELINADGMLPEKKSDFAAGYDLYASEEIVIDAWSRKLIPTKVKIGMPRGVYGRIAPRSGLATRGITVDAGVIDADYRGEIHVLLVNHSDVACVIKKHERIAQLILEQCLMDIPVYKVHSVDEVCGKTARDAGGFGSTGK